MTKATSLLSCIVDLIGTMAIYASCTYGILSFLDVKHQAYLNGKARAQKILRAEKSRRTPPGPQDRV